MPCIFRLFYFFEKQILISTSKRRCRNAFLPPVSLCVGLAVCRVAHGFRYQPNRQKKKSQIIIWRIVYKTLNLNRKNNKLYNHEIL